MSKNLSTNCRLNQISHMPGRKLILRLAHVSERFERCSVGASGSVAAAAARLTSRRGPPSQACVAARGRCVALGGKDGLSMASTPRQPSPMEGRARTISPLAGCRALGARGSSVARRRPPSGGAPCDANGGHYRFAVGQERR